MSSGYFRSLLLLLRSSSTFVFFLGASWSSAIRTHTRIKWLFEKISFVSLARSRSYHNIWNQHVSAQDAEVSNESTCSFCFSLSSLTDTSTLFACLNFWIKHTRADSDKNNKRSEKEINSCRRSQHTHARTSLIMHTPSLSSQSTTFHHFSLSPAHSLFSSHT